MRKQSAQSFIETLIGGSILIILALFLTDVAGGLLAVATNDHLAKSAARAAANHGDAQKSQQAADQLVKAFQSSTMIRNVKMESFDYQYPERVNVKTRCEFKLPAPLPMVPNTVAFVALASEPILVPKVAVSSRTLPTPQYIAGEGTPGTTNPNPGGNNNDDDNDGCPIWTSYDPDDDNVYIRNHPRDTHPQCW